MNHKNLFVLLVGLVLLCMATSCTSASQETDDRQDQPATQTQDATAPVTSAQSNDEATPEGEHRTIMLKTGDAIEAIPGTSLDNIVKFMTTGEGEPMFTLGGVGFDDETMDLTENSMVYLRSLTLVLNGYPGRHVMFTVHTHDSDDEATRMRVTEERAERVRVFLEENLKVPDGIEVIPMGATEPIGDNRTEEGRAKNNRIELRID